MRLLFRLFFSLSVFLILLVAIYASGFVSGAWVYNERQSGINIPALSRILASLPLPDAERTFFAPASAPAPAPASEPETAAGGTEDRWSLSSEQVRKGVQQYELNYYAALGRLAEYREAARSAPGAFANNPLDPFSGAIHLDDLPAAAVRVEGESNGEPIGAYLEDGTVYLSYLFLGENELALRFLDAAGGEVLSRELRADPVPSQGAREALGLMRVEVPGGAAASVGGKELLMFYISEDRTRPVAEKGRFIAVDASGRLRMALEGVSTIMHGARFFDGKVHLSTFGFSVNSALLKYDPLRHELDEIGFYPLRLIHHDIAPTTEGKIVFIAGHYIDPAKKEGDGGGDDGGDDGGGASEGVGIQASEVGATGKKLDFWDIAVEVSAATGGILRTADLRESLDATRPAMSDARRPSWRHWDHVNAVYYDEAHNQLIFSARAQNTVFALDYESFALRWLLAEPRDWHGERAEKLIVMPDHIGPFSGQHDPSILSDGRLAIFDNRTESLDENGVQQPFGEQPSRVLLMELDEAGFPLPQTTEVWQPFDVFSKIVGGIDEARDGRIAVSFAGVCRERDGTFSENVLTFCPAREGVVAEFAPDDLENPILEVHFNGAFAYRPLYAEMPR